MRVFVEVAGVRITEVEVPSPEMAVVVGASMRVKHHDGVVAVEMPCGQVVAMDDVREELGW